MLDFSRVQNYFIACGYTDMRKQIDGLVAVVELQFKQKLDETSIFLFCGRRADRIKALYSRQSSREVLWDMPRSPLRTKIGLIR